MTSLRVWVAVALVAAATPAAADELDEARALRRRGIGLTVAGIGLEVAGVSLVGAGFGTPSCAFVVGPAEEGNCGNGAVYGNDKLALGLFGAGIAISIAADAIWIAGAVEWSINVRRIKMSPRTAAAR